MQHEKPSKIVIISLTKRKRTLNFTGNYLKKKAIAHNSGHVTVGVLFAV